MDSNKPEEIEIRTPNFRFGAKRWGKRSGIPILALHGWLDNAASFDRLAPLLLNFQFVALDFSGHGMSDHRPRGMHYFFVDYVADIVAVADELGWGEFALIGHSLGARVASVTAGTIPDRISGLILIEGIGPTSRNPEAAPQFLAKAISEMKKIDNRKHPLYQTVQKAIEVRSTLTGMNRDAAAPIVKRGLKTIEGGFTWRVDQRLKVASPLYMTEEQVNAFLTAIKAPVQMFLGASGYVEKYQEDLEYQCSLFKNLQRHMLPGEHYPHMDHPAQVAELIKGFLK
ncbi:MAG: alpha/beta hydrolase [Proteobacteria bacterium]|nr:alpha/beta hydrolase [Pseudomonadota bacterium]